MDRRMVLPVVDGRAIIVLSGCRAGVFSRKPKITGKGTFYPVLFLFDELRSNSRFDSVFERKSEKYLGKSQTEAAIVVLDRLPSAFGETLGNEPMETCFAL